MTHYRPYNYFYDYTRRRVVKVAGSLVHEQKKEPNRYKFIGRFFAHQQQPFIIDNVIIRNLYGKNKILCRV